MYEDEQKNIECESLLYSEETKENLMIDKKGCVDKNGCLHIARSVCDKRKDCFGVTWSDIKSEDKIMFCSSTKMRSVGVTDRHTFMKSSLRIKNFFTFYLKQIDNTNINERNYLAFP